MGRNYVKRIASNDGNTYCYDADREKRVIVEEREIAVARLPDDAVVADACGRKEGQP